MILFQATCARKKSTRLVRFLLSMAFSTNASHYKLTSCDLFTNPENFPVSSRSLLSTVKPRSARSTRPKADSFGAFWLVMSLILHKPNGHSWRLTDQLFRNLKKFHAAILRRARQAICLVFNLNVLECSFQNDRPEQNPIAQFPWRHTRSFAFCFDRF